MNNKKVAVATFPNQSQYASSYGKEYNFVTDLEGLVKGDKIVVDTVNGIQIAEFIKYDSLGFGEEGKKMPVKWVVQKIDLEGHNQRVEAAAKVQKLKAMMEAKRKKAQELEIYEILAKNDPDMAKLVEEFKSLQEVL